MVKQEALLIDTEGRGSMDISAQVEACVVDSKIRQGLCNVFIQHTVNENTTINHPAASSGV